MSCKDEISNTCGKKINAKCVDYEGDLHKNTKIENCSKPSVEDVIEDLNLQVDAFSDGVDLSALGSSCIEYAKEGDTLKVKEAFLAMEEKICEIADYVGLPKPGCTGCESCSPIFEETIACMGLELGELVDDCGEQPATVKDLLQLMLNELNK